MVLLEWKFPTRNFWKKCFIPWKLKLLISYDISTRFMLTFRVRRLTDSLNVSEGMFSKTLWHDDFLRLRICDVLCTQNGKNHIIILQAHKFVISSSITISMVVFNSVVLTNTFLVVTSCPQVWIHDKVVISYKWIYSVFYFIILISM